jgi:glycosyltransferase involved in cell wall biosynthesis
MTLLVRNEVDVIEGNIRFHLDHGVDFIVAMDNGSTDGTREVLEKFSRQGVLHLIEESSRVFEQEKWVNQMGRLAYEQFHADAVFHTDADELWLPHSKSLKTEIFSRRSVDVLYVPVRIMLLQDKLGEEAFPDDVTYMVGKPLNKSLDQVMKDVEQQSLLLFRQPDKVFCKTRKGYLDVVQGNHHIQNKSAKISRKPSKDIEILHFQIRGKQQFFKKIANSGEGIANLEKEQHLPKDKAWHVRRWYRQRQDGLLDAEYRRLVISASDLHKYQQSGQIEAIGSQYHGSLKYFHVTNP